MFKKLNKGISTSMAIGIILVLAVLVGGFTIWQYSEIGKEITELPEIEIPEKTQQSITDYIEENKVGNIVTLLSYDFENDGRIELLVGERMPGSAAALFWYVVCEDMGNIQKIEPAYSYRKVIYGRLRGHNTINITEEGLIKEESPIYLAEDANSGPSGGIAYFYFNFIDNSLELVKEEFTGVTEQTNDWKTYRNEEYDFEIKYPDQFSMIETYISEEPPSGIQLTSIDKDYFKGSILVKMFAKNERKSNKECIDEEQDFFSYVGQKIINSINFYHFINYPEHIGGYCGMSGGCHYKDTYRAFYNGNCYQVEYSRSDREFIEENPYDPESKIIGDVEQVPELFNQALTTFKFLD